MPLVSIIIPCYNEQETIQLLLKAICEQTFPLSDIEVIIADGMSTDRTREVLTDFAQSHHDLSLRIVDNNKKIIPAALNRAIEASTGSYIIRLDAHSIPYPDYVERCLIRLENKGFCDNVGGVWEIRPLKNEWIPVSIAAAAGHRLGAGGASYRLENHAKPEYVDTVPFGAFRRNVFDKIGMFDETLLANEDYEFNTRLKLSGGRIWLDPAIRSIYFSRGNLIDLWRQYWRYGFWKWRMLKLYPTSIKPRQALPPFFVVSLIVLIALSPFWSGFRLLLIIEIVLYSAILVLGILPTAMQQKDFRLLFGMPLAITTMHISWGTGFLSSLIKSIINK